MGCTALPLTGVDKRGHFHFLMHYIPDAVLVARHAFARSYTGNGQDRHNQTWVGVVFFDSDSSFTRTMHPRGAH